MATVDEMLKPFVEAPTTAAAEAVLDRLVESGEAPARTLGDCYDELAEHAADERDLATAARLERKALAAGCSDRSLARQMLAWYQLESGEVEAGEAEFAALRRERPGDVELVMALGNARSAAGMPEAALAAFDEAVALAKLRGTAEELERARIERRAEREECGLAPDEDDRLAPAPRPLTQALAGWAVAWFPPEQRAAALARWPGLADDFADPVRYHRGIEATLRSIRQRSGHRPQLAPLDVDELVAWAEASRLDAGSGPARSEFAATLARTGRGQPWPPNRNEPCWCRSGTKYKRCCGG